MTDEEKARLLARIENGKTDLLPTFSGHWDYVRTVERWRVYVVHDPCHDRDSFVDDRNTVIALHDGEGLWRIVGRELNRDLAEEIADGRR